MGRNYYDQKLKDEAIRRFLNGETSGKIAKELDIESPDQIRKWVQAWRKKHNLPATGYRKSDIAEDVDEIIRLGNVVQRVEEERDIALKALSLVVTGEVQGWKELLSIMNPKYLED